MLSATFSNVPFLAMTARANKSDQEDIKKSMGLKNCIEVVGNPDCRNVTGMDPDHGESGSSHGQIFPP